MLDYATASQNISLSLIEREVARLRSAVCIYDRRPTEESSLRHRQRNPPRSHKNRPIPTIYFICHQWQTLTWTMPSPCP
jgi:hypothetical protein